LSTPHDHTDLPQEAYEPPAIEELDAEQPIATTTGADVQITLIDDRPS
jgi:hypothetical protein